MISYIISFAAAFIALAFWFFRRDTRQAAFWQAALLTSLAVYAGSLLFADAPAVYRLQTLFRDFLFIGVFGAAFSYLAGKRSWFISGLIMAGLALFLYIREFQTRTFPYRASIPLDAEAELLIELKESADISELKTLQNRYGLQFRRAFTPKDAGITSLDEYYTVNIPQRHIRDLVKIQRQLQRTRAVIWTEENELIQVSPLDAKAARTYPGPSRYGLNDPGVENLWAFQQMAMENLYNFLQQQQLTPSKKALIAILDTGVDSKHEDLKGNYKSLKGDYDNDPKGHGTHCAGIAAAVSNNGLGIASFTRSNTFYQVSSVKVLSAGGMGTQKSIIDGMLFAADQGADILSMSLGGPSNQSRQNAYEKAVQYANKKGAIVVAAAGNSNRNAKDFSPANTPGVICISAVDNELNRAAFSNYVSDVKMGLAAPGVDIYSTIPGNKYAQYSGTSMATPQVAGLLGLMKSLKPDLDTETAFSVLEKTGKSTKSTGTTGKFIQPAAAIQELLKR